MSQAVAVSQITELKYLKAVFLLGGCPGRGGYVKFTDISRVLEVAAPTVSIMVRKLEERGLLKVEPRVGAMLTWKGLEALAEHCWKKAIIDTAMEKLGVPEADRRRFIDRVSIVIDVDVARKLWDCLGRPERCPRGLPIIDINDREKLIEWVKLCCENM
ncbi:MAG: metal-dependent transcriptional regulator [Acidilobaceae archaeon]